MIAAAAVTMGLPAPAARAAVLICADFDTRAGSSSMAVATPTQDRGGSLHLNVGTPTSKAAVLFYAPAGLLARRRAAAAGKLPVMRMTTDHDVLPDASAFADLLGPDLSAADPDGNRIPFKAVRLPPLHVTSGRIMRPTG